VRRGGLLIEERSGAAAVFKESVIELERLVNWLAMEPSWNSRDHDQLPQNHSLRCDEPQNWPSDRRLEGLPSL
jgi:hypothetical protein